MVAERFASGARVNKGEWCLQEAADMVDQAQLEKDEGEREAQEVRRLMEIDADEEIEALKSRWAYTQSQAFHTAAPTCVVTDEQVIPASLTYMLCGSREALRAYY